MQRPSEINQNRPVSILAASLGMTSNLTPPPNTHTHPPELLHTLKYYSQHSLSTLPSDPQGLPNTKQYLFNSSLVFDL